MSGNLLTILLGALLLVGSLGLRGDLFNVQLYDTYYIVGWPLLSLDGLLPVGRDYFVACR